MYRNNEIIKNAVDTLSRTLFSVYDWCKRDVTLLNGESTKITTRTSGFDSLVTVILWSLLAVYIKQKLNPPATSMNQVRPNPVETNYRTVTITRKTSKRACSDIVLNFDPRTLENQNRKRVARQAVLK